MPSPSPTPSNPSMFNRSGEKRHAYLAANVLVIDVPPLLHQIDRVLGGSVAGKHGTVCEAEPLPGLEGPYKMDNIESISVLLERWRVTKEIKWLTLLVYFHPTSLLTLSRIETKSCRKTRGNRKKSSTVMSVVVLIGWTYEQGGGECAGPNKMSKIHPRSFNNIV